MEVKAGYKQTEVGIIPKEWDACLLGSLGTFSKGQGVRKDEALSGDIPCVRYGEIYTHHNDIIRVFNSRISSSVAAKSKRLKKNDLLFAGSGETKSEIGKCVAFISREEAYAGGDIVILSPNKGDSRFLGYLLNAPAIVKQKSSKGQGDAVVHISAASLSAIKIPFPPLPEQQAIANALSDADGLIESLEQLIEKKRQIKQGVMQELLTGKRRLPGFSGKWEKKCLGDLITLKNGYAFKSTSYCETGKYRIVTIANVQAGEMKLDSCSKLLDLPSDLQPHQKLSINDFLISMTGNVGRVCLVSEVNCVLNQRVGKIVPIKVSGRYLFAVLNDQPFLKCMIESAKGGAQPNLSTKDIYGFNFCLPCSKEEQEAIADVYDQINSEILILKKSLGKLLNIKQAMMQDLLTGKVRLV